MKAKKTAGLRETRRRRGGEGVEEVEGTGKEEEEEDR